MKIDKESSGLKGDEPAPETFDQLRRLRTEAGEEREREELLFALELAKFCGERIVEKKDLRELAENLPENLFVKNSSVTNIIHAAMSKRNYNIKVTRSDMIYLHLKRLDVPIEQCSHYDVDNLTEPWLSVIGRTMDEFLNRPGPVTPVRSNLTRKRISTAGSASSSNPPPKKQKRRPGRPRKRESSESSESEEDDEETEDSRFEEDSEFECLTPLETSVKKEQLAVFYREKDDDRISVVDLLRSSESDSAVQPSSSFVQEQLQTTVKRENPFGKTFHEMQLFGDWHQTIVEARRDLKSASNEVRMAAVDKLTRIFEEFESYIEEHPNSSETDKKREALDVLLAIHREHFE